MPVHHLHGDADAVVPLADNSQLLADRYRALGGPVTLRVPPGRGHDMWTGWFQDPELADFAIDRARRGVPAQPRAGSAPSSVR